MPDSATIADGFRGDVIGPEDADYDEIRRVWNGRHDRRPRLILCPARTADVVAAVNHARQAGLAIAVRGGGHSFAGHGTADGGLVIDLRRMAKVEVDPIARRAIVQAGATLGDLDRATQEHGLVVPAGIVSHTGVAGLTLGGGVGRLMRRFGLTIDHLVSLELVTADGRVVHADERHNTELFWALRGGGGNFGVVTSFEFTTRELTHVVNLGCFHEFADAQPLFERARKAVGPDVPDELLWTASVRKAPATPWMAEGLAGTAGVVSQIEWCGDPEYGREFLTGVLKDLDAVCGGVNVLPFTALQCIADDEMGHGQRSAIRSAFAHDLPPELVDVLVERGRQVSSPRTMAEVLPQGGAIARVPSAATAYPFRDASWLLNVQGLWDSPAQDATELAWVRDTYAALQPFAMAGTYANFLDSDESADRAYGSALGRLKAVKAEWDPGNVFRRNANIRP